MAIDPAPRWEPPTATASRSVSASRYIPGWARFIIALWTICLMLLGLQHLCLWVFIRLSGG
jgi:hypothetical protein